MVGPLRQALGDTAEVIAVPFGVSPGWYAIERSEALPRRWLVVARVTRAKIGPLFEWGERHFRAGDELHLLGPMQETLTIPPWVRYHGPTNPEALRTTWFPSATGLITLSTHDEGRPQVLLEAMAAGLPVIASRQPAHDDVVRHGETGFIVDSYEQFEAALACLSIPDRARRIGADARAWTKAHIGTWSDTAVRYRSHYARLLDAPA
jgi:glycosyltransferase involved in cell wall biosynthesis